MEKKSRTLPHWAEPQYKRNPHKFEGNPDLETIAWLPAINLGDCSPRREVRCSTRHLRRRESV